MCILNFINQIRKIVTFILVLGVAGKAYSQEIVTVDSIYENPSELLLRTTIIQFDSNQTAEALKTKFKNWAGLKFRNLNEIIVSETNEQIVLNYIDKYIWDAGFGGRMNVGNYYKMVAQFKNGKIRLTIFDDGNTFIPSNSGASAVAAHSTHYRNYFDNRTEVFNKGMNKAMYRRIKGYIDLNRTFFDSIDQELKKPTEAVLKDDW
jgi:hypothetical protein